MNILNHLISDRLIFTLGWTIFHSLWQGALVALGFALLLIFLRGHDARTRYFWGLACLVLVLAISLLTFINIYQSYPITPPAAPHHSIASGTTADTIGIQEGRLSSISGILNWFKTYFTRHLSLIVAIWLMGILILILRLTGGILYNQRLRSYGTSPVNKAWQDRLDIMCRDPGVLKPVSLIESSLVKNPLTIGHFKPVILVPLQMLGGLPHAQVEALIAHEMAHILRKDYFFNIVQSFVEVFFFFHPGIRWISSIIRNEREHCCDDIAVSISGDSINFARALTSLQETRINHPGVALAALGAKPKLLKRIKRLLYLQPSHSRTIESFVGCLVLTICLFTLVIGANSLPSAKGEIFNDKKQEDKKIVKEKAEKAKIEAQLRRVKEMLLRIREEEALRRKAQKREIDKQLKKIVELQLVYENRGKKLSKIEKQRLLEIKEVIQILKRRVSENEWRESARLAEKLEKAQLPEANSRDLAEEQKLLEIKKSLRHQEMNMKEQVERQEALAAVQRKELAANLEIMKYQNAEIIEQQKKLSETEQVKMQQLSLKMKLMEERHRNLVEEIELQESELRQHEARLENFVEQFLLQLYQDNLMKKEKNRRVRLTTQGLYIGGIKQKDRYLSKYLALYKKLTGSQLQAGKSFIIDQ